MSDEAVTRTDMQELLRLLAGMFFCIIGGIGSYVIAGETVYFLFACVFIIIACSIIVGVAR